ncbi:S-layer homology domain-containing protein [Paenibacillus tritici]|uniref:CBM35 domain-containing protein n=1 Tax=Paenibacillus tritici TaxID=1873425 RepID=UPI001BA4D674|nr:CBM35 domain-containing protein [Paenibacillus tritici]QUL53773.1 S-layer homology domain-containing protein [Paenibacillus tritici]
MRKKRFLMLPLAFLLSFMLAGVSSAEVTSNYVNPLMGGADPTIARAADGYYYSAFSGDNNITLKRHETILGVSTAKSKIVWKKPDNFGFVWGPYIYRLEGKWYLYFSSGPEESFGYGHPSSYVLENASPDPFEGTWELKGESANEDKDGQVTVKKGLLNTQGFGLACGVVSIQGQTYFTYTKYYYYPDPKDPSKTKFDESPTIVKMKNPWTLEGPEGVVARPQYDWEKQHDNINEGAAVVERNGKTYFAYSASSFMNDNYSVGVSVANAGADVMQAESWMKHPEPVMKRSDENSSYGPGSPLFLKSEDDTEDWIMYHGIPTHGQGGGNRGIRAQRIHWDDQDFINLGIPSNPGTVLNRPSGEEKSEIYEAEEASQSGVSRVVGKSGYASGGLYEKFSNSSDNNYVEFTVNTNAQGTYSLDFRYNNNTPSAVNMKLKVNGEAARDLSFASNAGFDANFDIQSVHNMKLNAGSNKIRLSGKSNLALDALIIKRSSLYEAEDAVLSGNAKVDRDHAGYSGTGFAGGLWVTGSAVTFKVNAAAAGSYSVNLGYGLGFNDDRTLSMYVNGQKMKRADFFNLGNWDRWADRYDNVFLKEGENTIMYKYDKGDTGNVNLDYITVTEATTWHYGAEDAKLTGAADTSVVYAKDGNMGTGYVTGLSSANSSVEFAVTVENAASYDVKLRYARETAGKTLALYLNGTRIKNITLPATGGAAVWKEQLETLSLKEGTNHITYKNETDHSGILLIDSIHLNKRTPWRYQAEDAARTGSLQIARDHLWYEGNGFVGGFEQKGDALRFQVNVPNTAAYTSTLRYSGAQSSNITMSMYVNGQRIKQVSLPPTANWELWANSTESVNLNAGNNIIEFIREQGDTGRFNIDSLTIDKTSGGFMSSIAKKIIPEKMVKIQPKHSGKSLDVDRVSSDPLAVINQWANGDGNNQLWRFLDLGTGYYQIQSVHSGHVLDLLPGSAMQQLCQNTRATGTIPDTQQWKLVKDSDYYKVVNKSNNKVITVDGASNNNGAAVRVADDQGKDNQRMRIEIRNLSNSEISALSEAGGRYEVTFNASGGSPAQTVIQAVYGEPLTPPAVTKEGYELEGWFTDSSKWDFAAQTVPGALTLTAKWELKAPEVRIISEGSLRAGSEGILRAAGTGTGTLSYSWYVDKGAGYGEPVGAGEVLNLPVLSEAMTGYRYKVVVTGEGGLTGEQDYLLKVLPADAEWTPPAFGTDLPSLLETVEGEPVMLLVEPAGDVQSIEWEVKRPGTEEWLPVTSVTGAVYRFVPGMEDHGTQYRVGLTGTAEGNPVRITGTELTLKIYPAHELPSVQPFAATVNPATEDHPVTFSVVATSTYGELSYRWLKNDLVLNGATGSSLTIENAAISDTGAYKVEVTNTRIIGSRTYVDTVYTEPVELTVNPAPVTPTNPPSSTDVPSATPVLSAKPQPAATPLPSAVVISAAQLSSPAVNGLVTVQVGPATAALLPVNAGELLGSHSLRLQGDTIELVLAPELLKQLAEAASAVKGSGTRILLKAEPKPLEDMKLKTEAGVSLKGRLLEYDLSLAGADGTLHRLDHYAVPVSLRLTAGGLDPKRLGLYRVGTDGTLTYLGGAAEAGGLKAALDGSGTYALLEYSKQFSDVPASHWAFEALRELSAKHLIRGISELEFQPGRNITRAEFVQLMANALQLTGSGSVSFTDVPQDAWYQSALSGMVQAGLVTGRTPASFQPNAEISREEMTVILMRAYRLRQGIMPAAPLSPSLKDAASISGWAAEQVTAAAALGFVQGRADGTFAPKAPATRAEAAQILLNVLK